jgi:short-subunit dehydrogenase
VTESGVSPLALVTGASSGIGYELAGQFCQAGFDVIAVAEDDEIIDATDKLRELGGAVEAVQTDLATPQGVELAWAAVRGRPLDAVAINAGVGVAGDFARDNALDDEMRLVNLNVASAVHLAKLVLPGMIARRSGRLLFSSSIAATMPGPYHATYAASKAFLLSFAEGIRHELRDTGVTVIALMPGPTDTEFFERAGLEDTKLGQMDKDDPAEVARQGFEAMMAGKDHVITGSMKNKVQASAAKVLPETAKARMQGGMTEPGSGQGEGAGAAVKRMIKTGADKAAGLASNLTSGAAGAAGTVWDMARHRMAGGDDAAARWLVVTIACPPEQLTRPGGLPDPIVRLQREVEVEVRVQPAPGDRGTELGVRLSRPRADGVPTGMPSGLAARLGGSDPRQRLRSALRDAKSLVETGEVLRPDTPPTTRPTVTGKVMELATKRAGGEGRL